MRLLDRALGSPPKTIAIDVPVFEFRRSRGKGKAKEMFISRGKTHLQPGRHFDIVAKRGHRWCARHGVPKKPHDWRSIPYHLRIAVVAHMSTLENAHD